MKTRLEHNLEIIQKFFKPFNIEGYDNVCDYSTHFRIFIHKKIDRDFSDPVKFHHDTLIEFFDEAIKETETYKDMKTSAELQYKALQEVLEKANAEIVRLKDFETYYNMHFKIQHGKDAPREVGSNRPSPLAPSNGGR